MHRLLISLFAITVASTSVAAQSVTGTWNATFDVDITMKRDGDFAVKARGPATLVLEQRGDSVVGTWTAAIDVRNGAARGREVSGTFDGRVLKLTTGLRQSEVRVDGVARTMQTRTDWMATVQGNRLTGTMFIRVGDREPPARKWEAERK